MRFLNRKWVDGGYDEETTYLYLGVYLRHLEDIAPDAPTNVRVLGAISQGHNLIGSRVAVTSLDAEARSFHLVLRIQTIEGDRFMDIRYTGVDPDAVDEHAFDGVDYVLTDELDVCPGDRFEHRILLSPDGEFVIQFDDLQLKVSKGKGEEEE
ncbi:MAG: hypothetical protein H6839_05360 [Planctomycetes bacterium]|nr:hypothetical protein [Planctomycetota bacterium]